jgi:hypothetical protein
VYKKREGPMATFDDVQGAYRELKETIVKDFNVASGGPIKKIAINAPRSDNGDLGIAIILDRELTYEEEDRLPKEHNGVEIEYIVDNQSGFMQP